VKKIPYRHVCIFWQDAKSSTDWRDLDEALEEELAICVSTGYIIKENDTSITLAQDFSFFGDEIDSVGNLIVIPVACIVNRRYIDKNNIAAN
tara:strand:+ start:516 stop:791 length:276 start_codon:yes stop_codon:yes gene_type:complete